MLITTIFTKIGNLVLTFIQSLGRTTLFLKTNIVYMFTPPFLWKYVLQQIYFIGVKSVSIIILTGFFTGMVLTLQSYYVLSNVGAEATAGAITTLSLIRELGPVMTALMVTGRAGSAITAQIGIMRISDQIDAIDTMALNPYKYLTIPNIIASVICLPLLVAIFVTIGVWGGEFVSVKITGLSVGTYYGSISSSLILKDLIVCLIKSLCFGLLIAWVSCYKGFYAGQNKYFGAEGVSRATTQTVVLSSVLILISDYIITSILMFL